MKGASLPSEYRLLAGAEMLHQIHEQLGGLVADLIHPLHDRRIAERLSRHIQTHHRNGPSAGKGDISGVGVGDNIKLGSRRHVSVGISAAHEDDLLDLRDDRRLQPHRHSQVCHRAGGNHRNVAVGFHQRVDHIKDRVLILQLFRQRLKYRAVQTCLAVDIGSHHFLPDHRASASRVHRHIQSQALAYVQGVHRRLLKRLVSGNYRNSQKVDLLVNSRQRNGDRVVMAGITVQNDFSLIHIASLLFMPITSGKTDAFCSSKALRSSR